MSTESSAFREALLALTEKIIKVVSALLASNAIYPEYEEVQGLELHDFVYTNEGIINTRSHAKYTPRKIWVKAFEVLKTNIIDTPEYRQLSTLISQIYDYENVDYAISKYCSAVFRTSVDEEVNNKNEMIDGLQSSFINDLSGGQINGKAIVKLSGIVLESMSIQIDKYALIRQTTKIDLETVRPFELVGMLRPEIYDAILELNFMFDPKNGSAFHEIIEKYTNLLRLFGTGCVQVLSYKTSTDSVTYSIFSVGGSIYSRNVPPWQKLLITAEMECPLQKFAAKFVLPLELYSVEKKPDEITTAYDRYSETLLELTNFERKIATAIMGIEALICNDSAEVSYKLRLRTAKLLSCLSFNPIEVNSNLKEAYSIRSSFAHGSYLRENKKKQLQQNYHSLAGFQKLIINYLRIVLIVFISSDKTKNEMIGLIDHSLIDNKSSLLLFHEVKEIFEFIIA